MNDEELTQRMRAAAEAVQMTDSAEARHLEAISAALTGGEVAPIDSARSLRRRKLVASVVAVAVIAPAGLAAASEGSLPGDRLYPVKQLSERVLVLFDSDVIARHRLEEIEALEKAGSVDSELYEQAREALADLGEDHPLWQRLAASGADEDRNEPARAAEDATVDDDTISDVEQLSATLELPDGSTATFTIVDGELVDVELPTGWALTEVEDDEATLVGAGFEVEVELRDDGTLRAEVTDLTDQPVDDDVPSSSIGSDDDATSEDDTSSETEPTTPPDDDETSEDGSGSDDDEAADDDPTDDDSEDDTSDDG